MRVVAPAPAAVLAALVLSKACGAIDCSGALPAGAGGAGVGHRSGGAVKASGGGGRGAFVGAGGGAIATGAISTRPSEVQGPSKQCIEQSPSKAKEDKSYARKPRLVHNG
jgi:hypothetical protein